MSSLPSITAWAPRKRFQVTAWHPSHHVTAHHIPPHLAHSPAPTQPRFTTPYPTPCLFPSHPIPSHLITPHHILSHHITSHPIPSHPIPSHPIPSHPIISQLAQLRYIPSHLTHLTSPHPIPPRDGWGGRSPRCCEASARGAGLQSEYKKIGWW